MTPQATLWIAGGGASILFLLLWLFWVLFRLKRWSGTTWLRATTRIRILGMVLTAYGAALWALGGDGHRPSALMGAGSGLAVSLIAGLQIAIVRHLMRKR